MLRNAVVTAFLAMIASVNGGCGLFSMHIAGNGQHVRSADGVELETYRLVQTGREHKPPRGILFYVQGSEPKPVLDRTGQLAGATALDIPIVLVERRGVNAEGGVDEVLFQESSGKLTRVADHLAALDHYLKDFPTGLPVIVMGESEGGDVAARIAADNPRVSHLILIGSGGGWTQSREFEHFIATRGRFLDFSSADDLERRFEDIRTHPDAPTMWAGHSYRRWSSYLWSSPLDDLVTLNIPILLAQGDSDDSVPVESARAVDAEFKRLGKISLTYREYAGVNHSMKEVATDRSALPLLELDILKWFHDARLMSDEELAQFEKRVRKNHPEWFASQ